MKTKFNREPRVLHLNIRRAVAEPGSRATEFEMMSGGWLEY